MSKEQPILMSTPMAQALLAGTKTETRRDKNLKEINENPDEWFLESFYNGQANFGRLDGKGTYKIVKCPWEVGNILWTKETWRPAIMNCFNPDEKQAWSQATIRFKAGGEIYVPNEDLEWFNKLTKDGKFTYKSSMFMCRKFARIFLQITEIKLERLHDITEEGAIAEGIEPWGSIHGAYFKNYSENAKTKINHPKHESPAIANPIESYKSLWESINGEGSWNANPWIWVIKFKKLENYVS